MNDDEWPTVFPGGVKFRGPVEGHVNDWTPEEDYGAHPAHVAEPEYAETGEQPHDPAAPTPKPLAITKRDVEMFQFLTRNRMATYDQLGRAFNTTAHALRQRMPRLHAAGYVVKHSLGAPALAVWMPTRDAVKLAKLALPVPMFSSTYEHTLGLTDLVIDFAARGATVITETEIRAGATGRPHSSRSGSPGIYGGPSLLVPVEDGSTHRPDMVVFLDRTDSSNDWRVAAVELELTDKGPKRLRPILKAYRDASHLDGVIYYVRERGEAEAIVGVAKAVQAMDKVRIRRFPVAW